MNNNNGNLPQGTSNIPIPVSTPQGHQELPGTSGLLAFPVPPIPNQVPPALHTGFPPRLPVPPGFSGQHIPFPPGFPVLTGQHIPVPPGFQVPAKLLLPFPPVPLGPPGGITSKRQFQADYDQVKIIFSNNLHRDIENKYRGTIENRGYLISIFHENENTAAQMQIELEELIKKYSFDDDARWFYMENDGSYRFYGEEINCIIESRYREVYYQLSQENYQHYSLNIEISYEGRSYIIEFAQLGGVHRQKRKNVEKDTIRAVKRQAAGEDLNKQYVRSYNWLWESPNGKFKEYNPDEAFIIEISWQEYLKNEGNSIIIVQGPNGYAYEINLETQVQVTERTNFKRRIKRVTI